MSVTAPSELITELRDLVQRIGLISHIGGTSYDGKIARDTSESIGGRRPTGADHEPKPRRPKSPRVDGDLKSEKAWDEYDEELAAWLSCYQRRTPAYFSRQLERCHTEPQLQALVQEAHDTLEAWKRTPIPNGQEPVYGSPQWKRYVAESPLDGGELARKFNVTRQYIHAIRKAYR